MRAVLYAVLAGWTGVAVPLAAQTSGFGRGAQIRINGDLTVDDHARDDVVIVVNGNALVRGTVRAVVVAGGDAVLEGAHVEDLTVINGRARLDDGSGVSGNVHLIEAELDVQPGATVGGRIERGHAREMLHAAGFMAAIFAFGLSVAVLLSGLVAAAVAPGALRRAGDALTAEPWTAVLAALLMWLAMPVVAVGLAATVVGMPAALGLILMVMPAVGFLGYLVVGTRVGDWLLVKVRGRVEPGHPYVAALIGLGLLTVAAHVPLLGGVITVLAGLAGGGAVGLTAWRAARWSPRPPVTESAGFHTAA